MGESPVDLSEVTWISSRRRGPRPGYGDELDPGHEVQLAARDLARSERRILTAQRSALGETCGAVADSTRAVVELVERLVHELRPMHRIRHDSEVRHFVWCSFDELTSTIAGSEPLQLRVGRVRLRCAAGRRLDHPRRYEADGRLHLPASRPDLRVRLVVEPWWRNRTAVTLRLRPSRRWRYPRRYFDAAHGVVSELVAVGS